MLTNTEIRNLKGKKRQYKISDGEGLMLIVQPNGEKYWRLKYSFGEKEKTLSIGRFPEVGLQEARQKKYEAREMIRNNRNPSHEKRQQKIQAKFTHDHSFKAVAKEWFDLNKERWDPAHAVKLWRRLEMHVLPQIGFRPVAELKPLELLNVIRLIEKAGSTETAHCVFGLCNRILKYSVIIGATEHNPAINLSEALKPNRHVGYPVIPVDDLPEFLAKFEATEVREQDRLAFKLLLLTALRTGELRYSKWAYVSVEHAEIKVPGEIMKMKEAHVVPLSRQAIEVLDELRKMTGHQEWLFPNPVRGKHPVMSENVINIVIENMGYKGRMVGHSFRKLFSTILNEEEFPYDAIERQLAHRERNKVRAAYNHAQHLKSRRFLMQWWADYLDRLTGRETVQQSFNVGESPRRNARADFDRLRIDSRFDPSIPSALADGDEFQHGGKPNDFSLN